MAVAKSITMLDFIEGRIKVENGMITKEEFKRIRNSGSEEELIEAVRAMEAAGGYDNLD